ncbi:MAG: hypothetical protein U0R19_27350 [Bryobacteraceae bacterium]
MRIIWHIFRKDVWMLRWAVLATVVEMGLWAWAEVASGGVPWRPVYLLRQAILMGWCFAACVVTLGDMTPEGAPDWSTRPISRRAMLASKLVFMAVVYHLPYFLACAAILWGKGFMPWHYWGRLFEQQLLCAAMLSVPGLALASVVGSFGAYAGIGVGLIIVGMGVPLAGDWQRGMTWVADPGREWWLLVMMVLSAMAVLVVQCETKLKAQARLLGLGLVAALVMLYLWVPASPMERLRCGPGAVAGWSGKVRQEGGGKRDWKAQGYFDRDIYSIPLAVPEARDGLLVKPLVVDWTMQASDGRRFASGRGTRADWGRGYLNVGMSQGIVEKTEGVEARMHVVLRVDVSKPLAPVWRRSNGVTVVPGLGRCGSWLEGREEDGRLHVFCESPGDLGRDVAVTVHAPARHWRRELRQEDLYGSVSVWLSPVRRVEADLMVVEKMKEGEEHYWEATRAEVEGASLEFVPEERVGCEVADFGVEGRWDHAAGRFWAKEDRR